CRSSSGNFHGECNLCFPFHIFTLEFLNVNSNSRIIPIIWYAGAIEEEIFHASQCVADSGVYVA
uniref:Uncharacterized protein n=1 Tax=Oryza brachyantha TaxID=4533 RepID=J3L1I6_ORYBR